MEEEMKTAEAKADDMNTGNLHENLNDSPRQKIGPAGPLA